MIEIDDKILSEEIVTEYFCCDLGSCKGECCVEGDAGAPLDEDEIAIIEDCIDEIRPFMSEKGIEAVNIVGVFEIDCDGDYTTTLVNGGECAFVVMEGDIALCAIEKAYRAGKIDYIKPRSCHLYPIRTKKFSNGMEGFNYHRWNICRSAIANGQKCGCKVYQGVETAIKRVYGDEFYGKLEEVDRLIAEQQED